MKLRSYHLTVLTLVVGLLPLNLALADEAVTQEYTTGSITISYNVQDLANPTELASLYARIRSAAREVCGGKDIRVPLYIVHRIRECTSRAMDDAVGEINDTRLTAFHQSYLTEMRQS